MFEHRPSRATRRWRQLAGVVVALSVISLVGVVLVGPPLVSAVLGIPLVAATKHTLLATGAAYLLGAVALLR